MVIATPCYFGCKFEQLFLCLSKFQGSIFLSIHYRLSCVNMLGLFLTTTPLRNLFAPLVSQAGYGPDCMMVNLTSSANSLAPPGT